METDHWTDVGVDGRIPKKKTRETGWEDEHWVNVTQGRDGRRGLVNVVMNLRVLYSVGNLLTS
jgi:hypothetical protein